MTLRTIVLATFLINCSSSSEPTETVDAPVTTELSCGATIRCLSQCSSATDADACAMACIARESPQAQTLWQALLGCAVTVCMSPAPDGTVACTSTSDMSPGCRACVQNTSVNSEACAQQATACIAN